MDQAGEGQPLTAGNARRPEVEGEWWLFEEPPARVTRVRSDDMRDIVVRDRDAPSLWAWSRRDGRLIIPLGLAGVPWLDLNLMAVMYDDTANDARGEPIGADYVWGVDSSDE